MSTSRENSKGWPRSGRPFCLEIFIPEAPKVFKSAQPKINGTVSFRDRLEREQTKRYDEKRGTAAQRGYGSRWQKARAGFLRKHPLCVCCEANDRVQEATVLDHIEPHRGDMDLFWQRANWQALCKTCHDSIKARVERQWDRGQCTTIELKLDRQIVNHWFK